MKYSLLVALLAGHLNAYSALDSKLFHLLEEELDDIKHRYNITLRDYLRNWDTSAPSEDAPRNNKQILTGQPKFVSSYIDQHGQTCGMLYEIQTEVQTIPILHLYCGAYEMGRAQGTLMKNRIMGFYTELEEYTIGIYSEKIRDYVKSRYPTLYPNIPNEVILELADANMHDDLTKAREEMTPYFTPHLLEEFRGIARALDISQDEAIEVHIMTEGFKGSSSLVGAWGDALANMGRHPPEVPGSSLLHAHTLDWDMDSPYRDYHQITVYHPYEEIPFINIGWSGMIGLITGINEFKLTASTIYVNYPDSTFEFDSEKDGLADGHPYVFLLRDILTSNTTHQQMVETLEVAHRSKNLILGLSDGKDFWFNSVQYSPNVINFMNDTNLRPGDECEEPLPCTWHKRIENIVYHSRDWASPGYNRMLGKYLQEFNTNLTFRNLISDVLARTETGKLHSVIYDVTGSYAYVAFARPTGHATSSAYLQAYTRLDLEGLFTLRPRDNIKK